MCSWELWEGKRTMRETDSNVIQIFDFNQNRYFPIFRLFFFILVPATTFSSLLTPRSKI